MCQRLNNQIELDQFAESGGMPVLDIVKHVGAGIASVLLLGVMKLAALIYSLLPENDRTQGSTGWSVHMPRSTSFKRSARHPFQIRRGIVGRTSCPSAT